MTKNYLLTLLLSCSAPLYLLSQAYYYAAFPGDTLVLTQTDYCGQNIQWEVRAPGEDWQALAGAEVNAYEWVAEEGLSGAYLYRSKVYFAPDTVGQYSEPVGVRYVHIPSEVQPSDKYQQHHVFHVAGDTLYTAHRTDAYREWGCYGTIIEGAYGPNIGDGVANTAAIVAECDTTSTAAYYCDTLTASAYTDWYLPAAASVRAVARELTHLGEFDFNEYCWSSTQVPEAEFDFVMEQLAEYRLFPYDHDYYNYTKKYNVYNIIAARQIVDFPIQRVEMTTTFAVRSYRGFITTQPARDSFTNVVVEYIGSQPNEANYYWDFDGGEVISGSGAGPYEIRYDHSRYNLISMYFEDENCTSGDFESEYFKVDVFEDLDPGLPTIYGGCLRTADFNNDGLTDVVVTGSDTTALYWGDGVNLAYIDTPFPALRDAYVSTGDFDNDGYVDIALCGRQGVDGQPAVFIYHNLDGERFEAWPHELPAVTDGFVEWLDYNNDGKLDLLLSGEQIDGRPMTQLYAGDREGIFTPVEAGLHPLMRSSVSVDDYNRDGRADLFLLGFDGNERKSLIYKNTETGFTLLPLQLKGIDTGTAAWADYNQDGLLDFVYAGNQDTIHYEFTGNQVSVDPRPALFTRFYQNMGRDSFRYDSLLLEEMDFPSVFAQSDLSWADFNGDGMDDLAITGMPPIYWVAVGIGGGLSAFPYRSMSTIFKNIGGAFETHHVHIPQYYANNGPTRPNSPTPSGFECASIRFVDFNNDHRPDLIREGRGTYPRSTVYVNQYKKPNEAPWVPDHLQAVVSCDSVQLSWNESMDDHTLTTSVSYEVYVGVNPGSDDVLGRHNKRHLRQPRLSLYGLDAGTYYWSVQAVDNALAQSDFAEAGSFVVGLPFEPFIYQSNDTLYSNYSQGNQWYDVNGPISGATDSIFVVELEGDYYAEVNIDDCFTANSNVLEVILSNVTEDWQAEKLSLFPNPTEGFLQLRSPQRGFYQLLALDGGQIAQANLDKVTSIDMSAYPAGIYHLIISLNDGQILRRIVMKSH